MSKRVSENNIANRISDDERIALQVLRGQLCGRPVVAVKGTAVER